MRWAEISLLTSPVPVEAVSSVFTECGCAGVMVVDPRAVSSDPFAEPREYSDEPGSELCTVTGYLPVDDRLEAALDEIQTRLGILVECDLDVSTELTLRVVDDAGWADAWKSYFKPLRVGQHFVIKPSWESWDAAPGDRIIEIDPGMAFGSGSHETTRLCLMLLEEAIQPGQRVLDWGTGSGILALGAACLGATEILAVDLDPVAVRVAAENVERNALTEVIQTGVASIESIPATPPFDWVIANIVADPIIEGAAEIRAHLRPGGQAIVSGIIDLREAEVVAALEAAGLRLVRTLKDDDWRAFHLEAEA